MQQSITRYDENHRARKVGVQETELLCPCLRQSISKGGLGSSRAAERYLRWSVLQIIVKLWPCGLQGLKGLQVPWWASQSGCGSSAQMALELERVPALIFQIRAKDCGYLDLAMALL